jgi:hypothetical protein
MSDAASKPELCFVAMPFGTKHDAAGPVAFDAVYKKIIVPAIEAAGLEPLRADEEMSGGIIHKPMFERLILSRYAIADLTTANANVFYELGIRHAARPGSTILIFADGRGQLPFDVAPLRAFPYRLDPSGAPVDVDAAVAALTKRLEAMCAHPEGEVDSPISALLDSYCFPDIARLKTDEFRDRVDYSQSVRQKLGEARRNGIDAVAAVEKEMRPFGEVESAAVIDLFLSYRAVEGWDSMIAMVARMPKPLASTVLVREQLALALNRTGAGERAEEVLLDVLKTRGPSSETLGILGRVYKDRWQQAVKDGQKTRAAAVLDQAIDAYRRGFEADWRDAYPGVNAVTLMELRQPPDPAREELLPIVRFAVLRRLAGATPDYWDYATLLELAALTRDEAAMQQWLGKALVAMREGWEGKTTANNLRLIAEARQCRGEDAAAIRDAAAELVTPRTSR